MNDLGGNHRIKDWVGLGSCMMLEEACIEFDVVRNLELLLLPKIFELCCKLSFGLNIKNPTLKTRYGRHSNTDQ